MPRHGRRPEQVPFDLADGIRQRAAELDDHEIDFSTVRVSEVSQLEVTTLGILLVVDPLQEVPRHEVLESE